MVVSSIIILPPMFLEDYIVDEHLSDGLKPPIREHLVLTAFIETKYELPTYILHRTGVPFCSYKKRRSLKIHVYTGG